MRLFSQETNWGEAACKLSYVVYAILVLLVCMTKYADYDLWWHLKLGEYVARNGMIPWADAYSYTATGKHQFVGEWLGDLCIFLAFDWAGFLGLNLLKALVVLMISGYVYLLLRSQAEKDNTTAGLAALLTLLVMLFAIRFRLFVRPYLFSMLFTALFLYGLQRWHDREWVKKIYLLPAVMLIWANMSVGAVFGVFIVGVAAVCELIKCRSFALFPVLFLTMLASLISPETYNVYLLAFDLTSDPYRQLVGEYQPITKDILFGSGMRYTLPFQILTVGCLIYFIFLRGWKNLFHLILFVFFLFEAFRQVRLIELFSIVAAPFFAATLLRFLQLLPRQISSRKMVLHIAVTIVVLFLIPKTIFNSSIYTFGVGPKAGAIPEKALKFLEQNGIKGRMFNSYAYGGYLIWAAEGRPVFIDGRYRRVYSPKFYGEYKQAVDSAEGWKAAERKYGFDYAILEYDLRSQSFPMHLADNPDWAVVYWDNYSFVAVRRTPEREALIRKYEYILAKPRLFDFRDVDAFQKRGSFESALAGLDREIALNADNQFPVLAKAYLLYSRGTPYYRQIADELGKIVSQKPDFAIKHSAYATVLAALGEDSLARIEAEKALALDQQDAAALALAKKLGIEVKIKKGSIPGHP